MDQKTKNIILGIALVILIFIAYSLFFKKDEGDAALVRESVTTEAAPSGVVEEFLILLRTLTNLRLDTGILRDETYGSLRDESVELMGQPAGRTNPFAPL